MQDQESETKAETASSVVVEFDQSRRTTPVEPPLSGGEIRQLRKLAAVADQLIDLLGQSKHGATQCPTWRRIQEEYAEMTGRFGTP